MSGILGQADLSANTLTELFTVPTAKVDTFSVNFCNRGNVAATIRLAIATTATPGNDEWFIYDAIVEAKGSLERTGLVAQAARKIMVLSSVANVAAIAYGFEE